MRKLIFLIVIALLAATPNAQAEVPPTPERKTANLEQRAKELERELGNTKDRLVKIGRTIQDNEKNLQALEIKISDLEVKRDDIQEELKQDQKSISRLILALQRIKRVPPEALIAKPDAPLKTAQSAMLMGDIIPTLNNQAEKLKSNLKALEEISADLKMKREKAIKSAEKLKAEQEQLSALVEKRQNLYAQTNKDLEAQQKRARKISRQAKNVRDLVSKLKKPAAPKKAASIETAVATPIPQPGRPQLPLSGIIRTSYNQPDAFGAPSKGLEIEGRGGALIVVPMGGIVRFAGHFKNYGNMIIIEHEKGYHSLIAGLEKIDTVVGQSVSSGEPLGNLHYSSNGSTKKPTLYYELRRNGAPINPAKKFTGLS